jgi:Phage integrase, N-terminal SAM-like domain
MLYKIAAVNSAVKARTPPLQSTRLLDQVRERARHLHYSFSTEKTYLYWVRLYIRWHGLRHPRDKGPREVEAFLTASGRQPNPTPSFATN